ncbi:MAG: acetylxylan esterase [Oscillospiraceae bacterium]
MPMTDAERKACESYLGTNPCPADFDAFWAARVAEATEIPLECRIEPSDEAGSYDSCDFLELHFRGIRGEWLYAKYLKPRSTDPVPLVLQFHGYPGASRSWAEQASYAGMGCAIVALDCPGQGGRGTDPGGYLGTTVSGHIVAGLDGDPKELYYVRLYQNICILCRIVAELSGIDRSRIYVNGASQGGGIGIACAALNPQIVAKAAILYPFLSDYQKVWELGADEIAYEGLRYYSRWFDPAGERTEEVFTRLGYIDTHNFAHLVQCPVLFGTGLDDTVCPPITQFGVYNNLHCPKRHVFFPGFGHEEIQEFDDLILDFFGESAPQEGPAMVLPPHCTGERVTFQNPKALYYHLTFPAADGTTLRGRYICPAAETAVPTVLMFGDFHRPVRGWHHMTRFIAMGYAVLALENRQTPFPYEDEAACQTAFSDGLALTKLALALPRTAPGKLIAWGEGLGGGLAIGAAGQTPEAFCRCAALHPMPPSCKEFAPRLTCPLLLGTALMDQIAPPEGQQAVYDSATCPKQHLVYPKYEHERINFFEDKLPKFFHI